MTDTLDALYQAFAAKHALMHGCQPVGAALVRELQRAAKNRQTPGYGDAWLEDAAPLPDGTPVATAATLAATYREMGPDYHQRYRDALRAFHDAEAHRLANPPARAVEPVAPFTPRAFTPRARGAVQL